MRLPAQIWPAWLPQAMAKAESRISSINNAATQPAIFRAPLPPLVFSATFQSSQNSLLPSQPQSASWAPMPASRTFRGRREMRAFSTSTVRRPDLRIRRQEEAYMKNITRAFSNSPISPLPLNEQRDDHNDHVVPPSATSPPLSASWNPPTDASSRPVTIIGSGVLGRRLAVLWASTSRPVNLYDTSPSALRSSVSFVADNLGTSCSQNRTLPGKVHFTTSLVDAVRDSWLVIEAVPEDLEVKISVLGRIDRTAPRDCIIATNSASFRSRELVSEVQHRERVLNTLYYIPPANKCVELMSCGYTAPNIFPFLVSQMEDVGLEPMLVHNESTGMIFPRIFGAMKREVLQILQERVASPEDVDELFKDFFHAENGICAKMDEVGLDTVARTEEHFLAQGREGGIDGRMESWEGLNTDYLEWLKTEYIEKGKLGEKSGEGLVLKKKDGVVKEENAEQEVWRDHSLDLSGM